MHVSNFPTLSEEDLESKEIMDFLIQDVKTAFAEFGFESKSDSEQHHEPENEQEIDKSWKIVEWDFKIQNGYALILMDRSIHFVY